MPKTFTMRINDEKKVGQYDCRESAAYYIAENMSNKFTAPLESVAKTPITLDLTYYDEAHIDPEQLQIYLQRVCTLIPLTKLSVAAAPSTFGTALVYTIRLEGEAQHVTHAMWWCLLFARIIFIDGFEDDPAELLDHASLTKDTFYGTHKSSTRADCLHAFKNMDKLDAGKMFAYYIGPIQTLGKQSRD